MNIYEQLIRDEGEVLQAYQDKFGYWTIGVGHLIDARKGGSIPHDISLQLLQQDVMHWAAQIAETWPWTQVMDEPRRMVLVNMAHMLGIHGLSEFVTFLGFMQTGEWEKAASDLLTTKLAGKNPERVKRLAEQIQCGEWR